MQAGNSAGTESNTVSSRHFFSPESADINAALAIAFPK
jgi:hypothetical protein